MTIHDPTNPNHAAQNLIDSLISLRFMAGVDLVFKLGKSNENQGGVFVLQCSFRTCPNCLISCACCQHSGSSIAALALLRCTTSG